MSKPTVINKFNEAGVPLTWSRLCLAKNLFEKKAVIPPWHPSNKTTLVLPLKSPEENLETTERLISRIIILKIEKAPADFKLPIKITEI